MATSTKKPSLKQQLAEAKRELAETRKENSSLFLRVLHGTKESERRLITSWRLTERFHQELQTLNRAGFVIEVMAYDDGSICTSAVKRVAA